jgi:hypothetical protein
VAVPSLASKENCIANPQAKRPGKYGFGERLLGSEDLWVSRFRKPMRAVLDANPCHLGKSNSYDLRAADLVSIECKKSYAVVCDGVFRGPAVG